MRTQQSRSGDTAAGGTADWLDNEPLAVRESMQHLEGADGRPLLFDEFSGRYVAISRAGAAVLQLMQDAPTAREAARRVSAAAGDHGRVEESVFQFLGELREAGVFTAQPPAPDRRRQLLTFSLRRRVPRWVLTRSLHRLLEPVAALLRPLQARVLVALVLTGALGSAAFAGYTLVTQPGLHVSSWIWLAALLLALQIGFHEMSHALICQYLRVPVREAGIMLMLFCMPVAFVDRTDSYRVRGRGARILIALAGPISDTFWAAAAAGVVVSTHGRASAVALLLLHLQLFFMIVNLNPLLPSDGFHAIESAFGALNLRGRSFAYLLHLFTRAQLPSYLHYSSWRRRSGYLAFGLLCAAYGAMMIGIVVLSCLHIFAIVTGL